MALAAMLSVTAAACGNAPPAQIGTAGGRSGVTPTEIRVGGLGALTGPLGSQWAPVFDGAQAYFDTVNAAGGVHGRRIVTVSRADDGTDPSSDVAEARGLVEQDHVFAVIPVATPVFAGGRYLAAHSVPTFGWNINPEWQAGPTMFGQDGSWFDPAAGDVAGPYIAKQLGLKRIAILAYAVRQSADCATGQERSFRRFGFDVVLNDSSLPIGVGSVDADVSRIARAGGQLVVDCMDPTGSSLVSDGLARAGLGNVAQFWLNGYDQDALSKFPRQYEGVFMVTDFVPFEEADTSPALERFIAAMQRRHVKPSAVALAGWISADMFVAGLQRAGRNLTRAGLVDAVNSMTDFTAHGIQTPVDWRTDHNSQGKWNCSAYLQVQHGRFAPVFHRPFVCLRNDAEGIDQLVDTPVPGLPGEPPATG